MDRHGANLPWVNYGGDFGANVWHPEGGLAARDLTTLHRALKQAARAGAETIRWFVLCDGRAGLITDRAGAPTGLQDAVLADMATALDALASYGLRMMPVLFDFTWTRPAQLVNGVQIGGRAGVLRDPVTRHQLWRAVDPLLAAFGSHPGIACWDVWNEPEWMCAAWTSPGRRLTRGLVRRCLGELVLHVRWHTRQPVTVGLASARGLGLCRHLDLDLLQVHWYDHLERRSPLAPIPQAPWSRAPILLGEFPTRGSTRDVDTIVGATRDAGYAGAWPWSLLASDGSTDGDAALRAIAAGRRDARPSSHDT
ncbi:MAG TPA: hypothetical protein VMF13_21380 [Luteitalea sp.]|nr:hypothetical protein [Luteitalea sp.]